MPELAAELRRFTYSYPGAERAALCGVDLELADGEFCVCAGRSGSGKSTLLRALCGLVPHYHGGDLSGDLVVCGRDVREHGPAELGGLVGLVAQDPETQVVSATVRGELELPLEFHGEPPAARARAIEEVCLALAIPHLLDRPLDSLSGGELQRVALAAALVGRPRMVLLDEPTSQLDPVAGAELIGLLRRLNEEWGTTVVVAEHRLERCLAAADRVLALAGGELAFDGEPGDFCDWVVEADPVQAPPAAMLFSLAGLRPLPVAAKQARLSLRQLGLEPDGLAAADTRPRASSDAAERAKGEVALAARDLWVERDAGDGLIAALRGVDVRVAPGERVALMGRNGAGKSTLLRAAAGLLDPERGAIEAPRECALLPQSPSDLFVRERVGEEFAGPQGVEALAAVGLAWATDRDPRDLSGGERERLALALVTAGREDGPPGLICLDEPTRGIDAAHKRELAGRLEAIAGGGAAVVVATHDVEFAARFAERVLLLGEGELIADGPAAEVLSGGWYFATEVARVLGGEGPITPEQGAAALREALTGEPGVVGR